MSYPRIPTPDDELKSWLARFVIESRRHVVGGSNSILSNNTGEGTPSEVAEHILGHQRPSVYFGEYQTGSAYPMNAEVTVTNASTFTDGTNFYQCSANTTWVC